jgi:hypothetical protein
MKKDVQISVRISSALRDALQECADADNRSLAGYITILLQQHIDKRQARQKK